MVLRKWNNKAHEYDPYEVPGDWYVSIFEVNMDTVVNCAECGKKIMFGQGYTSRKIHTRYGMGYVVCKDCYGKEIEEELRALHETN